MGSFAKLGAMALALGFASPAMAATNLVTNGDFSNGLTGWLFTDSFASPAQAYTATGNIYQSCCNTSALGSQTNPFAAFAGNNEASTGYLVQGLSTIAGQAYTLTFDLTALGSGSETFTGVVFGETFNFLGGSLLATTAGTPFQTYSFNFTAASAQTFLVFGVEPGVGQNDSIDPILDNVTVSAAPEPATWAMMILGFGIAGASLRRRRPATMFARA